MILGGYGVGAGVLAVILAVYAALLRMEHGGAGAGGESGESHKDAAADG